MSSRTVTQDLKESGVGGKGGGGGGEDMSALLMDALFPNSQQPLYCLRKQFKGW